MYMHPQVYYVFGFLLFVFLIFLVTCAEVAIVQCYLHLCHGDYRWSWRAFWTSGATAFYLFLYTAYYYQVHSSITGTIPSLLYFAYMAMLCLGCMVLAGSVGYFSCLCFLQTIYACIKAD